jgi:hypothetical protein
LVGVSQAVVDVARRARCERVDGQPGEVESCREVPSRVVEGSGGLLGFCWAGQRVGSVEGIGVSGTGRFLCDLKTVSAIGTGPDGAGVVEARMCQGPPVGARPWMAANRRVVRNASKPPGRPQSSHRAQTAHQKGGGVRWRRGGGGSWAGVDDLGLPASQPQGKGTLIRAHPTTTVN